MWVNFNKEENIVPDKLDPATGCPMGWTCLGTTKPCTEMDSCAPPSHVRQQMDLENTGFCLKYMIK